MSDTIGFVCMVIVVVAAWLTVFRYTFVQEGQAKIVTTLGSFNGVLLNWWGYMLSRDWSVVTGWSLHLPFGLRYVGIRFFTKVDSTISVQPSKIMMDLKAQETEPSERIPLDLRFQILFQIVNAWKYRFNFKSPSELMEAVRNAIEALLRGWVSTRKYDWVVNCKQSPKAIWETQEAVKDPNDPAQNRPKLDGLKDDPVIRGFEENWGVRILPEGIQLMDVGFTKVYQDLIALKEQKRLEAEGLAKKVETLVESRMAKARTNGDVAAFKELLAGNDQLKQRYEDKCEALTSDLLALEAGARTDIRGDGISATLDALVGKVVNALLQGRS